MPLEVILESELGNPWMELESIFDYEELEASNIDINQFRLLKYIDFYGNTTFNSLQMPDLILDLEELKSVSKQQEVIDKIIQLAKKCEEGNHVYLKFYGD